MEEYLNELNSYLITMRPDERKEIIDYYSEYILDAQFMTKEDMIEHFGTPKELAKIILTDHQLKAVNTNFSFKQMFIIMKNVFLLLLQSSVFKLMMMSIVVFLLGLAFISISFIALYILMILFIVGAIVGYIGIGVIAQSLITAITYIGISLMIFGLSLIIIQIANRLIQWVGKHIVYYLSNIFNKYLLKGEGLYDKAI